MPDNDDGSYAAWRRYWDGHLGDGHSVPSIPPSLSSQLVEIGRRFERPIVVNVEDSLFSPAPELHEQWPRNSTNQEAYDRFDTHARAHAAMLRNTGYDEVYLGSRLVMREHQRLRMAEELINRGMLDGTEMRRLLGIQDALDAQAAREQVTIDPAKVEYKHEMFWGDEDADGRIAHFEPAYINTMRFAAREGYKTIASCKCDYHHGVEYYEERHRQFMERSAMTGLKQAAHNPGCKLFV